MSKESGDGSAQIGKHLYGLSFPCIEMKREEMLLSGLSTMEGRSVVRKRRRRLHLCSILILFLLLLPGCLGKGRVFKRKYYHRTMTESPTKSNYKPSPFRPYHLGPHNSTTTEPSLLDQISLKWSALLCIAVIGVVVGVVINVANLHNDFQDLREFHRGYEGRRVHIAEGTLTSREYLKALKTIQQRREREAKNGGRCQEEDLQQQQQPEKGQKEKLLAKGRRQSARPPGISSLSMLAATSSRMAYTANVSMSNGHPGGGGGGHQGGAGVKEGVQSSGEGGRLMDELRSAPTLADATTNHNMELITALTAIQEEKRKRNPHNHCNFAAFTSVRWLAGEEPVGQPHHLEWLQHHLPLYATNFIEDQDPEWRDLDYSIEIGDPPEELWEFALQYDFKIFRGFKTPRELSGRRNLLYQFRKWKKRRRKLWRIVVTERAKKEMASQDKGGGGLGGGGGPFRR